MSRPVARTPEPHDQRAPAPRPDVSRREGGGDRHRRRWADLSPAQRTVIVAVATVDLAGRLAMLQDLRHRPDDRLRGPRWAWLCAVAVSSAGLVPAAYFALNPRHRPEHARTRTAAGSADEGR